MKVFRAIDNETIIAVHMIPKKRWTSQRRKDIADFKKRGLVMKYVPVFRVQDHPSLRHRSKSEDTWALACDRALSFGSEPGSKPRRQRSKSILESRRLDPETLMAMYTVPKRRWTSRKLQSGLQT